MKTMVKKQKLSKAREKYLIKALKPILEFEDISHIQDDLQKVFNARWHESPENYKDENDSFWLLYKFLDKLKNNNDIQCLKEINS